MSGLWPYRHDDHSAGSGGEYPAGPHLHFCIGHGGAGAALATVLSQLLSAVWVLRFLTGPKTLLRLDRADAPRSPAAAEIVGLGTAGFIMSATNGAVQVACNATLRDSGGDVYVGIMTVLNSVRDVVALPIQGLTNAAQPVMGYNYGARRFDRVKKSIAFTSITSVAYMLVAWLLLFVFPEPVMRVFNSDPVLVAKGFRRCTCTFSASL